MKTIKEFLHENPINTEYLKGRRLVIIVSTDDDASKVYVNKKMELALSYGMIPLKVVMSDESPFIDQVVKDHVRQGDLLICQYPASEEVDEFVKNRMVATCDIDGLSMENMSLLYQQQKPIYEPCTAYGVLRYIQDMSLVNKNVGVVGRSLLVGTPLRTMLEREGYTVFLGHSKSDASVFKAMATHCDVIVSATGHDLNEALFEGLCTTTSRCIIDVGMRRDEQGLLGDVSREQRRVLESQGHYVTSVPGGVGLLTTWSIFEQASDDWFVNKSLGHVDAENNSLDVPPTVVEVSNKSLDSSLSHETEDVR